MVRLILIDDHDLVRTGLRRLLEDQTDYDVVAEGDCGEDALKLVKEHNPDVILMDLNMPGIGGLEATRKLKHSFPHLRIIIVTMVDDVIFPTKLLKAGASGYITKGAKVDEINRAIREVMANKRYISPDLAQKMATTPADDEKSPFDDLSERELQVLMMLMEGHRVNDISDKLCLSPKTISTYRYRLYDKLDVKNDIELTRLAIEHGIIQNH
ncbi:MAG: response regulator [Gammaproteobacteria bacterium]|nr:response regulator [Gammaproteobacteria bacterium]MDH5654173.1 response regulator [Gammaproteobacteria bacterium]